MKVKQHINRYTLPANMRVREVLFYDGVLESVGIKMRLREVPQDHPLSEDPGFPQVWCQIDDALVIDPAPNVDATAELIVEYEDKKPVKKRWNPFRWML